MRRLIIASLLLVGCTRLWSQQIDVYNHGSMIRIEQGALVSIAGDYQDLTGAVSDWNSTTSYALGSRVRYANIPYESIVNGNQGNQPDQFADKWILAYGKTSGGASLDAPIFLSGQLSIGGNIVNQSAVNAELIFEFENATHTGKVVLNGTGDQSIGGTVRSYFPNLEVQKTSGRVLLSQPITIDNNLALVQGNLNLNGQSVLLAQHGQLKEFRPGGGAPGITGVLEGYPGTLETTQFPISSLSTDYHGIGLGFPVAPTNFLATRFYRLHGPGSDTPPEGYHVGNGVNVLRVYKMETSTPDGVFPQLSFFYSDSELNGIAEGDLALYVSNDNGASWTKMTSTVNPTTNTVVATGPTKNTSGGVPVIGNVANIFVLAAGNCTTKPDTEITVKDSNFLNVNDNINICDGEDLPLVLSVPEVADNDYRWAAPNAVSFTSEYKVGGVAIVTADEKNYEVFVRNKSGCESENTVFVNVRDKPIANFDVIDQTTDNLATCALDQVLFDDASTVQEGTITQWAWSFDDNLSTTSTVQNPTFVYNTNNVGPQFPSLVVTSVYGCASAEVARSITVQTLPVPDFDIPQLNPPQWEICEDINVSFNNLGSYTAFDGSGSSLLHAWNFADGGTSNLVNPTYAFLAHGNYDVNLKTTVQSTGCYAETTKPIQVNSEPIPLFTPRVAGSPISEVCEAVYVLFDNQSTMPGGTSITFSWNFADATSSVATSPSKQYLTPNTFSPVLTVTSTVFGCQESYSVPITVHPAPKGLITVTDPDICLNESAVFTNESSILSGSMTYLWDFADATNSTSSQVQVSHPFAEPRLYKVKLTRTSDHGCTNEVSRNVMVHPLPVPEFQHLNACDGKEAEFYNNSVIQSDYIETYLWEFGDNTTSTSKDPRHLFPAHGEYMVTLHATSNFGCAAEVNHGVTIYRKPSFNLGPSLAGCDGTALVDPLTDTNAFIPMSPTASTFLWTDGSGHPIGTDSQLEVTTQGVYSVKITTPAPEFCESSTSIPVFMFAPTNLGSDLVSCAQLVLDAEVGLIGEKIRADQTQYLWKKNGVVVSSQQTLSVIETGDYEVTITRVKAGAACSSNDLIHVTIELPLTVLLPTKIVKCEGETLTLDAGVTASSYQWVNLTNGAVVGTEKTLVVTDMGNYRVQVTNNGCTASAVTEVVFSPAPSVSFNTPSLSFCVGESIAFTDYTFTSVGVVSTRAWDFGDNSVATDQTHVNKSYSSPGTYSVLLSATTDAGCTGHYLRTLAIHENPIVDFVASSVCVGAPVSVQNNSPAVGVAFYWEFDDETTSGELNPLKHFESAGPHEIVLTATNVHGCSSSDSKIVTINPAPELDFGGSITTCGGSLLLDAGNPGANYKWFDPANNGTTLSTSQTFAINTNRTIGLEVTNSFGCSRTDQSTVILNVPIVIDLGSSRTVCDSELLDAGYFPGGQYVWTDNTSDRMLEVSTSGVYGVSVTDQNGCSGSASVTLDVKMTPVPQLGGNKSTCADSPLVLAANGLPTYTYLWTTGASTPSISVSGAGNYGVTVSNGQCAAFESVNVTVLTSPTADFTAQSKCAGSSIAFTNTSTSSLNEAISFLWAFGDGTFSTETNPAKLYLVPDGYSVSLTATSGNGCTSEVARVVDVFPVPVAEFLVGAACTDSPLSINNSTSYSGGGSLSFEWDFGNGSTSSLAVPVYSYSTSGTRTINLIARTSNGCVDNYVRQVAIGLTPSAAQWVDEISSCDSSISLDAGNPGSAYLWADDSSNQTRQVTESGTYKVTVTSPDGCERELTTEVMFNDSIQPVLSPNIESCGSVILDPQVDAVTYLWSTGDQTATLSVVVSDQYSVQVINQDLRVGNASTNIAIRPIPTFDLGALRESCDGSSVEIIPDILLPVAYAWSTGSASEKISVTKTGEYSLTVTTPFGCSYADSVDVVFNPLPVLDFASEIQACGSLTLDATNPGSTYQWSTGSTKSTITVDQSGVYEVRVVSAKNCVASDIVDVSILALPELDLGPDITLCATETTMLDAGTSGNKYVWSNQSTERLLAVGSSGSYGVSVTNSNGCTSTDQVVVTVRLPLPLELGADRLLCNNAGLDLDAAISNARYEWGSNVAVVSTEKTIRVTKPGTYWVSVVDEYGCTAFDSVKVAATTQNIVASFLIPSAVDRGNVVQFAQLTEPEPTSYYWEFGDGGNSRDKNPAHSYFSVGEFFPTLVVSNGVCSDTLRKSITVRNARTQGDTPGQLPKLIDVVSAKLYPNPSSGKMQVNIELTTEAEVVVTVFAFDGHKLEEQRKTLVNDVFDFDLSYVNDGMYLVQVTVGVRRRAFKLFKNGAIR